MLKIRNKYALYALDKMISKSLTQLLDYSTSVKQTRIYSEQITIYVSFEF